MMADLENNINFEKKWFDFENQGQPSRPGNRT